MKKILIIEYFYKPIISNQSYRYDKLLKIFLKMYQLISLLPITMAFQNILKMAIFKFSGRTVDF